MCTVHIQKLLLRTGQAFILLAGTLFLGVGLATAADGGIVLDASLSNVSGAGAVWSNLPIGSLKNHAMNSGHMAIDSTDVITITNVIGSGGTLQQSAAEQTASFASYGNLSAGGGSVDAMNLFGTVGTELFDFPRYRAVAAATSNLYTACEFAKQVAANATLYGIVYVEIDVANDQGVSTEYAANSDCRNPNASGNLTQTTVAGPGSGTVTGEQDIHGEDDWHGDMVADSDCHNQSKFVSKFVEIKTNESGDPLEHVANSDYPEQGGKSHEYETWPDHQKQGVTRQVFETWPEHMKHGVTKQEYETWPEHMKQGGNPKDVTRKSGKGVPQDDIRRSGKGVPQDDIRKSGKGVPQDDIRKSGKGVPQDDTRRSGKGMSKEYVANSDCRETNESGHPRGNPRNVTLQSDTGSITVYGTLAFGLSGGTESDRKGFKIEVATPLRINPATGPDSGSTTLTRADFTTMRGANIAKTTPTEDTWPSGYASAWATVRANSSKTPDGVAISGYPTFVSSEDHPALMYSKGVVDIHGALNASGVVYTPNFAEIEQTQTGNVQYINGALIAGDGIFLEDRDGANGTAIIFDPNTLDGLILMNPSATSVGSIGQN